LQRDSLEANAVDFGSGANIKLEQTDLIAAPLGVPTAGYPCVRFWVEHRGIGRFAGVDFHGSLDAVGVAAYPAVRHAPSVPRIRAKPWVEDPK
jgi:hypothetical protein